MRPALAVLALAASASASAVLVARQIPSCANNCLFGPKVDLDGCAPTDNLCLCKSQAFVSKSTTCIEAACSGDELQTALSVSRQICDSVGVTLTSSPPTSTAAAAAPASTASTASTSAAAPASTASTASTSSAAPASSSNAATLHRGSANALLAAVGLAALAL